MAELKHWYWPILFVALEAVPLHAQSPQAQDQEIPWDKRSWEDRVYNSRYEDHYTFKHGKTYTLDPYIWAYTKEFAERFRMPEQWIEPELKGALAVAWRMTTIGETTCGLGGKADNCWKPLACQMDIYYDNHIELPWNQPEVIRDDIRRGLSSSEFLHDSTNMKGGRRYAIKPKPGSKPAVPDPGKPVGIMSMIGNGLLLRNKQGQTKTVSPAPANLVYFDREYGPGVGLLGYIGYGVCPHRELTWPAIMNFYSSDDMQKASKGLLKPRDMRPTHVIEIPESYMSRLRPAYVEQNKPNEEVMENLTRGFTEALKQGGGKIPGFKSYKSDDQQ